MEEVDSEEGAGVDVDVVQAGRMSESPMAVRLETAPHSPGP